MAYQKTNNSMLKDNIINIMNIFIEEKYRNKKIGKRLVNEVENWANNFFEDFVIELDCISNNINVIEFYKSLGFSTVRIKMRKNWK